MKTLKTLQSLSGLGRVLSKIAFVFSVIGACGCIAGIISLSFAESELIKLGGVTLHGLISEHIGADVKSIIAALSAGIIACAGEAVVAKFAELYFKNEQGAGTPLTLAGAAELMRLGILAIAVPVVCAAAGSIVRGIVAAIISAEKVADISIFGDSGNFALGMMFIVASLLCRYGAELAEGGNAK